MKLIFCPRCQDIFSLREVVRTCTCGYISGRYVDNVNAEISKYAIPLGIANSSFLNALLNRPTNGMGIEFDAFVIPRVCSSIVQDK